MGLQPAARRVVLRRPRQYLQITSVCVCVCEIFSRSLDDCVIVARFTVSGHFSYIFYLLNC